MKKILLYLITFIIIHSCSVDFDQLPTADNYWVSGYEIVGSDTLLVDSLTGSGNPNWVVTYCADQLANIDSGYVSAKSDCRLNGQPITTLFAVPNYADTTFFEMAEHILFADSTEALPYRLESIWHADIAVTGQDKIDLYEAFNVPTYPTNPRVVPDVYPTITAAISASSNGDTIIVKSGDYDEVNFTYWRYQDIIGVGDCYLTSTGASYVVLTSAEYDVTMSGFEIDAENAKGNCISGSSVFNGKHLTNCYLENANTRVIQYVTTSIQTITNKISSCVAIDEPELLSNMYCNFSECYFNNISIRSSVAIDSLRVEYCRYKYTNTTVSALNFNNNVANAYVNYNNWEDIRANTIVDARQSTLKGDFYFVGNTVTIDSLVVGGVRPNLYTNAYFNNNTFTNNSITQSPNLLIGNFNNAYVRDNLFITETGDNYAIDIASTSTANELYIERNIDSSYADNGYFIRVGTELTASSDNNINTIVIRDNIGYGLNYFSSEAVNSTHGLLVGFQSNDISVTRNNFTGYGLSYVFKGSSGTNSSDTKIWSNISSDGYLYGFYSKGIDSLKLYNNTSYQDRWSYYFTENTGSDGATNCEVINSAIETESGGYAYQFDVNSSSDFISSNNVILSDNIAFYNGLDYNWASWQGLGYDANSFNTDPNFKSSTELWPISPSDAIGNALNLGTPYDSVLRVGSVWTDSIFKKQQFARWSMGAYIPLFETIDNYVADTLMSIWADKMNQTIKIFLNSNDTIELETP